MLLRASLIVMKLFLVSLSLEALVKQRVVVAAEKRKAQAK